MEKISTPTLIKRILEETNTLKPTGFNTQRFTREQLIELYVWVKETKRTNTELNNKIEEFTQK